MVHPVKPNCWDDLPNGEILRQAVSEVMSSWVPRMFGYHLLKMGPLAADLPLQPSPIKHHFSMVDEVLGRDVYADVSAPLDVGTLLLGDYTHIPLQGASVDAVMMQLLLEFEDDPYRILRETDRVLIAGGYLFIVGINPLSPAFIGKLLPKYQTQLPWSGRLFMPSRVRDWLGLLGYQVVCDERRVYHSLIGKLAKVSIWQDALAAWLPSAGCVYIIGARKLESPLTPVQEKRKVRQPQWSTAPTAGRAPHSKIPSSES